MALADDTMTAGTMRFIFLLAEAFCGTDSPFPCDDHGHGTHTMGTMVGDDGSGNQVGMAPGASVDWLPQYGSWVWHTCHLRRMLPVVRGSHRSERK